MTATALNIAASPMPGAMPGAAATAPALNAAPGQGQAQGPLAGFEAMLATLFGAPEAAGLTVDPAKATAKAVKAGKPATDAAPETDGKSSDAAAGDGKDADASAATTAAPDALLALLLPTVPAVLTPPPPAATSSSSSGSGPGPATTTTSGDGQTPLPTPLTGVALPPIAPNLPGAPPVLDPKGHDAAPLQVTDKPAGPHVATGDFVPVLNATTPSVRPNIVAQAPTPTPLQVVQPAPPAIVTEALAAPAAARDAAASEPVAGPTPTRDKAAAAGVKAVGRVEISSAPGVAPTTRPSGKIADPLLNAVDPATAPTAKDAEVDAPGVDVKAQLAGPQSDTSTTASTTAPASLIHPATVAVRGSPQTVATLAAQIVKKMDGRSSRFDVQLDPAGLGKVDVRIEIGANGQITAAMAFDSPQAAAELKSRASELQRALEQAGFDISGGMSFDVAGGGAQGRDAQNRDQQGNQAGAVFRGRAFQTSLDTMNDVGSASGLDRRRPSSSAIDIRI